MLVLIFRNGMHRVPTTRHKQVFSLNKHQSNPIQSHPIDAANLHFMLILGCSTNMTHKIEWRQNAQNWFIQKFDGIWMDLLCARHLNWIAALALLIELIFDQFGTCHTHHDFDGSTRHFMERLLHFLLTTIDSITATDCIFNTVSHISYICNAYISLCGCEKFIALWQNQVYSINQPYSIDVNCESTTKKKKCSA